VHNTLRSTPDTLAVDDVVPRLCQALRCHSEALTGHSQNSANILICSRTYPGEGRSKFKRLQLCEALCLCLRYVAINNLDCNLYRAYG
jgi:hypothetical protein